MWKHLNSALKCLFSAEEYRVIDGDCLSKDSHSFCTGMVLKGPSTVHWNQLGDLCKCIYEKRGTVKVLNLDHLNHI